MMSYHKQKGRRFHWIGGDESYGQDSKFRNSIADMDLLYMPDIHSTDGVYMEKADISIAAKKFKRGRNPSLPKGNTIRTKACNIVKGLREEECKTYTVSDAAKGSLVIEV